MNAVQFLQYANLGTGFVGVANSLGDMIYKVFVKSFILIVKLSK